MNIFNDSGFAHIKKSLEAYNKRQKVIANNIANVTTPGYKAKRVNFEDKLKEMKSGKVKGAMTHKKHIKINSKNINELEIETKKNNYSGKVNGINNVDVDKEMVRAAENKLKYMSSIRSLKKKYDILRSAISGR